jgi:hypothetical protein
VMLGVELESHVTTQSSRGGLVPGGGGAVSAGPSRSGRQGVPGGTAVRFEDRAVGQDLAGVLEDDHAVAEQAPALLGEGDEDASRFTIDGVGAGTGLLVLAHRGSPVGGLCVTIHNDGDGRYLNPNDAGLRG